MARRIDSAAQPHKKLVIGIDYGTTSSGVAYAVVKDGDDENVDIHVVRNWPQGMREEKIPSDLAYDEHGVPSGYGFEFPHGVQPLQWIKLLLEPTKLGKTTLGQERVWQSYHELEKLRKHPVDAIGDYLRWLWDQIEQVLEESGDDVGIDEVVVVITLPASWSDQAKDRMLQAARKAGIESGGRVLKFRIEPEAAALFELKARAKKGQIEKGDCFIICDAGGGTVDVVTFQVISLEPLSLNQVVVSDADFCGSAFISAEFESQLRFLLGPDFNRLSKDVLEQIKDKFEQKIKRKYNPSKPVEHTISVTGLEDNEKKGISDGKLRLKDSLLRRSFEEIITQVLALLDGQKDGLRERHLLQHLKAILIVGGFGASDYLHTRIRQEHPDDEGVRVWRSTHSWTAVVQGAVQCEIVNRTLYAPVNARLSRFHYGIPYHRGNSKMVHWFVHKGQNVRDTYIEPYPLRLEEEEWIDDEEYVTIHVQLVKSSRESVAVDDDSSLEPHVDMVCKIPAAIRYSREARLVQEYPIRIWRIPAELVLAMDGPLLTVRCRIQGKDVGLLDLKYHEDEEFPIQHMINPKRLSSQNAIKEWNPSRTRSAPDLELDGLNKRTSAISVGDSAQRLPSAGEELVSGKKVDAPETRRRMSRLWPRRQKSEQQPAKPQRYSGSIELWEAITTRDGEKLLRNRITQQTMPAPPDHAQAPGVH